MSRRRTTVTASAVILAILLLAAAVGLFERSRWVDRQNAGIAAARAAVGANLAHPKAYRMAPLFDCLLYGSYSVGDARELCFAPSGAIVETIERHLGQEPKIWSLRSDPAASKVRVDPTVIAHMLDKMGAQRGDRIRVGSPDLGAQYPIGSKLP
jgi:hypothetical protein